VASNVLCGAVVLMNGDVTAVYSTYTFIFVFTQIWVTGTER